MNRVRTFPTPAIIVLAVTAVVVAVTFLVLGPMHQNQDYHHFADDRTMFGIANFLNVASNLGFLIVGLKGLVFLLDRWQDWRPGFDPAAWERPAFILFFAGVTLVAFGSAYYHYAPSDAALVWDRLPMTLCFMGLVAAVIGERVNGLLVQVLIVPLVGLGVWSVFHWKHTGDLRLYGLMQFLPFVILPLIAQLFPGKYIEGGYAGGFLWYGVAKLLEVFDDQVYSLGQVVSGHTLKHVASALACASILTMLRERRTLQSIMAARRSA